VIDEALGDRGDGLLFSATWTANDLTLATKALFETGV
jgi:hypothetical protein